MGTPRYPDFETVTANAIGAWQRVVRNGRPYWVGPASMLVPGVLNGSKGPLLYTAEDTRAATPAWNGMPIVLGHPQDGAGRHISAFEDGVFDRLGLGYVDNALFDGRLTAKAWVDEEWAGAIAPDVLNAIKAGDPVELSTGLGTRDEEARPGSTWNGKSGAVGYTHVARDHRPDHLAILVGQKGACSIRDGCGLGVNSAADTLTVSAFCATGEGGGVDPTCSPGEGGGASGSFTPPASKYGGVRAHYDPEGGIHSSHRGTSGMQVTSLAGGGQRVEFHSRALEDLEGLASDAASYAVSHPKSADHWHALAAEQYAGLARALENRTEFAGGGAAKVREARDKAEYHRKLTSKKTAGRSPLLGNTDGVVGNLGVTEDPETACERCGGNGPEGACTCPDEEQADAKTLNAGNLLERMWGKVVNAFLPNQPRSQVTGKIKRLNAGQGKGETHEAAQSGYHGSMVQPTARQRELGADAARQKAETGHNPPSWAVDEDKWEKSKELAAKNGHEEDWPYVVGIYQQMGGEIGTANVEFVTNELPRLVDGDIDIKWVQRLRDGSASELEYVVNVLTTNRVVKRGDEWCVVSESGKSLGCSPTEEGAKKRLQQVEYFKHKSNSESSSADGGEIDTSNQDQGDDMKTRKDNVAFLVANCDCWKGKQAVLNDAKAFTDAEVEKLVGNAQLLTAAAQTVKDLRAQFEVPDTLALNEMPDFIKKKIEAKKDDDEEDDDEDDKTTNTGAKKKGVVGNAETTVNFGNLTAEQKDQLSRAIFGQPVSVVTAGLNLAVNYEAKEKQIVINKLTDHMPDGPEKVARQKKLAVLGLNELYDRLADRPVTNGRSDSDDHLPSYLGRLGGAPAERTEELAVNAEDQILDAAPPAKWPTANRRGNRADKQAA